MSDFQADHSRNALTRHEVAPGTDGDLTAQAEKQTEGLLEAFEPDFSTALFGVDQIKETVRIIRDLATELIAHSVRLEAEILRADTAEALVKTLEADLKKAKEQEATRVDERTDSPLPVTTALENQLTPAPEPETEPSGGDWRQASGPSDFTGAARTPPMDFKDAGARPAPDSPDKLYSRRDMADVLLHLTKVNDALHAEIVARKQQLDDEGRIQLGSR